MFCDGSASEFPPQGLQICLQLEKDIRIQVLRFGVI